MDILEHAMQMELDGEQYYRELAAKTDDEGLAGILTRMADDEVKHYNTFKQLREQQAPEMAAEGVSEGARTLFAELAEKGRGFGLDASQVALYEKARDVERDARDFYLEKAADLASPEARALVKRIADEEELHYQLLSSIVEFVARPVPGNWLENAEWSHREEY
jgi:rubrerythrin